MRLDQIMTAAAPVSPDAACQVIHALFVADNSLTGLAVVDADQAPIGYVDRILFMRRFNARNGRALYAARAIASLMERQPLTAEADSPVADFTRACLECSAQAPLGGFIVVRNGRYAGIGSAMALLQAACADNFRQAEALEAMTRTVTAAEAEAKRANALFQDALESMGEGVALFDADDRYVLWNRAYANLRHRTPLMRPGATFSEVIVDDLACGHILEAVGREEEWFHERLARRNLPKAAHEQLLPNGRWIRIEDRRLASGGVISVTVDITELRQREASLRLIFEENPVPLAVFDRETMGFLAVNPAACEQYGYTEMDFLNLQVADLLAPEERDAARAQDPAQRYVAEPSRTWTHLCADGRRLEVLTYLRQLTFRDRPAVIAATVDITAQKRAEAELESARWFLDAVVESIPEMLIVKEGVDHRIVLANRACEDLLGLPRDQIVGKNDYDLVEPEQAAFYAAQDDQVMASGQLQVTEEEPITTHRGLRYLQSKKIAMPMPEGATPHLLVISEDITERKAVAAALETARDQAEAASRAKSQFLANMSHEIRTPLNGVTGVVSVLARTTLDTKQREMVQIIQDSAATLEILLSDVLDLARVESGKMEMRSEPFAVEELVRRCVSLFRIRADQKDLVFEVDVQQAALGHHLGDVARLQQILNNLLSNAIKFTAKGGVRLKVSRNAQGGHEFAVTDTGIGFDEEAATKIFQRFEQADGSITRQFGGTGLGLSISRDLAHKMGGELSAHSVPGHGATFTLTAPLTPCAAPAEAEPELASAFEAPRGEDERPLRILVADDHATNRHVVSLILSTAHAELTMATNGAEAVKAFETTVFDLVLMDLQMPVMDGLTAIRAMRRREHGQRRTPILALSANAMPEHVAGALEAGADGHIAKPIMAASLLAAIDDALSAAESGDAQAVA